MGADATAELSWLGKGRAVEDELTAELLEALGHVDVAAPRAESAPVIRRLGKRMESFKLLGRAA